MDTPDHGRGSCGKGASAAWAQGAHRPPLPRDQREPAGQVRDGQPRRPDHPAYALEGRSVSPSLPPPATLSMAKTLDPLLDPFSVFMRDRA